MSKEQIKIIPPSPYYTGLVLVAFEHGLVTRSYSMEVEAEQVDEAYRDMLVDGADTCPDFVDAVMRQEDQEALQQSLDATNEREDRE